VNDLLGNLSFPVPSIGGVGVQTAVVEPAGPIGDFIGLFGTFGVVPYGDGSLGGCDLFGGGGGGAGAGCGTGCSNAAVSTRVGWLLLPLLVAIGRRRR